MRASRVGSGFSLIEVLVVLGIVAVLVGLLVPAIQRLRESSLRIQCSNNLRQIGIGVHSHCDTHQVLPTNGGASRFDQLISAVDGSQFVPSTTWISPQVVTFDYGVGVPGVRPKEQPGSWAYAILPFVGEENVYRNRSWMSGENVYTCLSRRAAVGQIARNDEFGNYVGGGWPWGKTDYSVNGLLVRGRPITVPVSSIRDGLSVTVLAGEKAMRTTMYSSGSWYFDEPLFLGGAFGSARTGVTVVRDSPHSSFELNWGSPHEGSCQFVFCDGSVKGLSYSISPESMHALLTPAGGDVVPEL